MGEASLPFHPNANVLRNESSESRPECNAPPHADSRVPARAVCGRAPSHATLSQRPVSPGHGRAAERPQHYEGPSCSPPASLPQLQPLTTAGLFSVSRVGSSQNCHTVESEIAGSHQKRRDRGGPPPERGPADVSPSDFRPPDCEGTNPPPLSRVKVK